MLLATIPSIILAMHCQSEEDNALQADMFEEDIPRRRLQHIT
jgi:hypothetical protein